MKPDYRALNPDGIVPTLVDGGDVLTQSLAIVEYLEETHPEPALLPRDPLDRAFVRSVALQIACDIHPVDNLRVLKYLKRELKLSDDVKDAWYRHWIESGFASLETRLANEKRVGALIFGDTPTLADLCIRALGVQRTALLDRFDALSDHSTHRRARESARRVRARRARHSAGRRMTGAESGFLSCAGFGASLIVASGTQNAFVLRQGLKRRHVGIVVVICAAINVTLIALGVGGMGALIQRTPLLLEVIRWFSVAFVFLYGVRAFLAAWRGPGHLNASEQDSQTALGAATTVLALSPRYRRAARRHRRAARLAG